MKKILVVNTVNTGYTGITSVIVNYLSRTSELIEYDLVLNGKIDEGVKKILQGYAKRIFISPYRRSKKPLQYSRWLKNIIKDNKYDVVHIHANSGTAFFDIHAAKVAGVPKRVCHSHSSQCKFKAAHKILKPLLNMEMTNGIACSEIAGKWLFYKNYTLLNNGIDVNKFKFNHNIRDEYRRKLNIEESFVVGHIGYMDIEKNHNFLIEMFSQLIKEIPNARLLLIGDGRLRTEIEKNILENNLEEKIFVMGTRDDVAQLYQCIDVFVLPSLWEGLPVSMLEAQTAGLPCIVSANITKQADLTGNVTYVGIEQKDIAKWIDEFKKVQQQDCDRMKFSEFMKKSDFNIENCVLKLLQIYEVKEWNR